MSVRFLVTADPQYNANILKADATLKFMRSLKLNESLQGIVVVGDLTSLSQYKDDFQSYLDAVGHEGGARIIYDGMGNHDTYRWDESTWIGEWVKNHPRETQPFLSAWEFDLGGAQTADNSGWAYHYAWKWGSLTFVHLNIYPGGPSDKESFKSLEFLKKVIENTNADIDHLIIFHHYGFDTLSIGDNWWTEAQREAYWDVIAGVKVIGIFTGHIHLSPQDHHRCDFVRPASRTNGPPQIPGFVAGAALNGVFLDVSVGGGYMQVTVKDESGTSHDQYKVAIPDLWSPVTKYDQWPTTDFLIALTQHCEGRTCYRLGIQGSKVIWVPENCTSGCNCRWTASMSKGGSALLYNVDANLFLKSSSHNDGGAVWKYGLLADTSAIDDKFQRFSVDNLGDKCKIYLTSDTNMTVNVAYGDVHKDPILYGSRVEGAEFHFLVPE